MSEYTAKPGAQTIGANILGVIEGSGAFRQTGYRILADLGLKELKQDQWYPMQPFCDFFEAIEKKFGGATLAMIGKSNGSGLPLPPELNTIEKVYSSFDQVYRMNFRNVPTNEGWKFTKTGPKSATIVCTGPMPDEYLRGIAIGFGGRFEKNLVVKFDETQLRRDKGGNSVTLLVNW